MMSMPPAQNGTAYFNFIASHDGIGMRPAEGILGTRVLNKLFKRIEKNGGMFSFRKVGSKNKVYEVNTTLFNALKKTDFDEKGGWATRMQMKMGLADLGNLAVAGSISSIGFGSIEKKVNERQKYNAYQYDFSSTFNLGKFFAEDFGLKAPIYIGRSESIKNPQYFLSFFSCHVPQSNHIRLFCPYLFVMYNYV